LPDPASTATSGDGTGPTRASKRKYGNMISGGEVSGKNFLMKETFEYAKERVANKRENETIDGLQTSRTIRTVKSRKRVQ
jgi:hypothetical protein